MPFGFYAPVRPVVAEPLDVDDVIAAHELLKTASNLRDLGMGGLMWWRIAATCSRHGLIVKYEETVGGPPDHPNLTCISCRREGITRYCLVEDLQVVVGREPPLIGDLENK